MSNYKAFETHEIQKQTVDIKDIKCRRLFLILLLLAWHNRKNASEKKTHFSDAFLETADGDPSFIANWVYHVFPSPKVKATANIIKALSFFLISTSAAWAGLDTSWGTDSHWGYPHARSILEKRREENEQKMKDLIKNQERERK